MRSVATAGRRLSNMTEGGSEKAGGGEGRDRLDKRNGVKAGSHRASRFGLLCRGTGNGEGSDGGAAPGPGVLGSFCQAAGDTAEGRSCEGTEGEVKGGRETEVQQI